MKSVLVFGVLLIAVVYPLCAQQWSVQDSLRLHRLLEQEEQPRLNPDALRELEQIFMGKPNVDTSRPWMEFNPILPHISPKPKARLTLRPYSANTPYNWDPVYQRKIDIDRPKGMTIPRLAGGVSPSGYSLMAIFTRDFWDRKGKRRRARTLEVLRTYGDSITVHVKNMSIDAK